MDHKDKSALLAIDVMGWRRDGSYWAGKRGYLHAAATSGGSTLLPMWEPFTDIAQAKEVQGEMVRRDWLCDVHQGPTGVYASFRMVAERVVIGAKTGETEAEAICEAAGLALGLWEASDD